MSSPARKADVYDQWRELPDTMIGQVIDGKLHAQARPALRHAYACSVLGEELGPPFRRGRGGPGGWMFLYEPELHFGDPPDILVPDFAGWRVERLPQIPDAPHLTLAPDWLCEVLSPSTQRLDRADKLAVYRREGVPHVWLIDPAATTLEILRLTGDGYVLVAAHAGDASVRAEPFDAISLELKLFWPA